MRRCFFTTIWRSGHGDHRHRYVTKKRGHLTVLEDRMICSHALLPSRSPCFSHSSDSTNLKEQFKGEAARELLPYGVEYLTALGRVIRSWS